MSVVAVRVGDAFSYHPIPEAGLSWGRADGLYRNGQILLFEGCDTSGIALAGVTRPWDWQRHCSLTKVRSGW